MTEEVSRKDLEDVVAVLSEHISRFYPGSSLHVEERQYRAWHQDEFFICEICCGTDLLERTARQITDMAPGLARADMLRRLNTVYGFPLAFSGEEMQLKLSMLPENRIRKLGRRFVNPQLGLLKTAPVEV